MILDLPWPPKELSPNARMHHHAKARIAKSYRETCYWLAVAANLPAMPADGEIIVSLAFHPPDKRRRDLDGCLGSCKQLLDALADALHVNDYRFSFVLRRAEPVTGGKVVVSVMP